MTAIVGTAHH